MVLMSTRAWVFLPRRRSATTSTEKISGGIEYYADYGRLGDFDSLHNQQQQIFVVTDLNVSPKWEINIGVGIGPTAATDHWIIKGILGRHFYWKKIPLDYEGLRGRSGCQGLVSEETCGAASPQP